MALPKPLTYEDVHAGHYVVLASCETSGVLALLVVLLVADERGDVTGALLHQVPHQKGTHFARKSHALDYIGLPTRGAPKSLWRTFEPSDENMTYLGHLVKYQRKAEYRELIGT